MTKVSVEQYDLIVIGGGMAGLPLSQKAAQKGRNTALVEKELLGGTCLNRGCIPTKTMIHSAKIMHHVRRAAEYGIVVGEPKADLPAIVRRKDEVVKPIRDGAYRGAGKIKHLSLGGHALGVNHLGFQVDTDEELTGLRKQVASADLAALDEAGAACCYAKSDKYWLQDPQGIAWETFHSLSSIPVYGEDAALAKQDDSACCVPLATQPQDTANAACCVPKAQTASSTQACCG